MVTGRMVAGPFCLKLAAPGGLAVPTALERSRTRLHKAELARRHQAVTDYTGNAQSEPIAAA
ncbi:MAG: hypothetical protein DWQ31_07260 [Planctomycetota bacterium]|nr:MAG: hypothetical protein DWQ31_07260 [Planctomycetota bacterium]REK25498.1 MAG: hypothetical protein DWQ42_11370 [Planctomycetota bacterium]